MTVTYEPVSGTLRGSGEEIDALRTRVRELPEAAEIAGVLRGAGIEQEIPEDDGILEAMRRALRTPVLTLEVSNCGPGGAHHHVIDAGINGVAVRWSMAGPELSELSASPFPVLPGLITRVVSFRPGRPPAEGAVPVRVEPETIRGLADDAEEQRLRAWSSLRPRLVGAVDDEAEASWQLVRAHCRWRATDGTETDDLAVYLRAGDDYFVLVESDGLLDLVPVPSITAWEAMMHVLPGADEVRDPRR